MPRWLFTISYQTRAHGIIVKYIYVYIYTEIIVWCEDEEHSIPLQVERKVKVKVNTQGKDQLFLLGVSRRQLPEDHQPV